MIEWALRYASMGLSVFPLRERDKRPAAPNGFKDATTDNQKIRALSLIQISQSAG